MALISAPTTYVALQKHFPDLLKQQGRVKLFEFDTRFSALAGTDFVYWDFNSPLKFVTADDKDGATGLREQVSSLLHFTPLFPVCNSLKLKYKAGFFHRLLHNANK